MSNPDRQVVAALVEALTDHDMIRAAEIDATDSEYQAAADALATASIDVLRELGALVPAVEPSVLSLTYRELMDQGYALFHRGAALCWLADQLPGWPSSPARRLADVLKIAPPDLVAVLAAEVKLAGVDLDGGPS